MNEIQITIDKNVFDNFNQFKSANILRILKDVELTDEVREQITNFLNVDICYFQHQYCPKGSDVKVLNWQDLAMALVKADEQAEAKEDVETKIAPVDDTKKDKGVTV